MLSICFRKDKDIIKVVWGSIAQVYGREQASRAWVTGESIEEDDMVMR